MALSVDPAGVGSTLSSKTLPERFDLPNTMAIAFKSEELRSSRLSLGSGSDDDQKAASNRQRDDA
jgi:hypothetical protein